MKSNIASEFVRLVTIMDELRENAPGTGSRPFKA
jgi:hypothetical protein